MADHEERQPHAWVDVKVKMEGQLLVHLELRGYRSDGDMTVQINHVSDTIVWLLQETPFIPTFVVTVFQGWRVCAVSWEVGGRIYAISEGGIVVALDYPLCHVELRLVATSSADAFGQDADRLEFRLASTALLIGLMWLAALVQFHHRGWWSAVCQGLP